MHQIRCWWLHYGVLEKYHKCGYTEVGNEATLTETQTAPRTGQRVSCVYIPKIAFHSWCDEHLGGLILMASPVSFTTTATIRLVRNNYIRTAVKPTWKSRVWLWLGITIRRRMTTCSESTTQNLSDIPWTKLLQHKGSFHSRCSTSWKADKCNDPRIWRHHNGVSLLTEALCRLWTDRHLCKTVNGNILRRRLFTATPTRPLKSLCSVRALATRLSVLAEWLCGMGSVF